MFSDLNADGQLTPSEILQAEHYYPFGMSQQGHSTPPLSENDYLFNGIERYKDFNMDLDIAVFRTYDAAIGRWWQIDPKNSPRESGYVGFGNNPVLYSDILGDTIYVSIGDIDAQENIKSLVPKQYRNRISINEETGLVSFNQEGLTDKDLKKGGSGMELLQNLENSTYNMLYSTTIEEVNETEAYGRDEDGRITTTIIGSFPDATYPRNSDFTYKGKFDGLAITVMTHLEYFDAKSGTFYTEKNQDALTFHALSEMFHLLETEEYNYPKAHARANEDSKKFYRSIGDGGVSGFTTFSRDGSINTQVRHGKKLYYNGKKLD